MRRENLDKLPFQQQLPYMNKVDLYRIMTDCSGYDELETISVIAELGKRYQKDGITERERTLLTLFGCSTDEKQYTLGIDMLTAFLPQDCEQYLTAIYLLAGEKEGQTKSVPRMKAAIYLMSNRPEENLPDVINQLSEKHSDFIQKIKELRNSAMIDEPKS